MTDSSEALTISGPAVPFIGVSSTGAPLRERQHHPHLGRQPGHEPDPGPGDVLTPVVGYGARKQSSLRPPVVSSRLAPAGGMGGGMISIAN
jgi:hypothetical protein